MNTIVFVLMTMSYAGYWVPTIEFSTAEKCAIALVEMENAVGKPTALRPGILGKCVKIEK